jgi:pyridoxamine 5'-phosphate oxidase
VALVFFWKELERQVRIEGRVEKISSDESDEYFATRPLGSQVSAIISPQSKVIPSREYIEERVKKYLDILDGLNQRPQEWGGYRVIPDAVEFWQGRQNRLHDRIRYMRKSDQERWIKERLAP